MQNKLYTAIVIFTFLAASHGLVANAQQAPVVQRWEYATMTFEIIKRSNSNRPCSWVTPTENFHGDVWLELASKLKADFRNIEDSPTACINAAGRDGWELVTQSTFVLDDKWGYTYTFKRSAR